MAFVGMRYPIVAQVKTEVRGQPLTYEKGTVMGHAIMANITLNRNENPLYADDVEVENDNSITNGTIEIGLDDISNAVRALILAESVTEGQSGAPDEYALLSGAAPYVGVGYIRVRRLAGVTTYQGVWWHKAQFSEGDENAQTKGETIEWQTPTVSGRLMGVYVDSSGAAQFRVKADFTTEDAAIAWLRGKAGA